MTSEQKIESTEGSAEATPAQRGGADWRLRSMSRQRATELAGALMMFLLGAVAGNFIDRGMSELLPDELAKAARVQQDLIADRTDNISQGVQQLQTTLSAIEGAPTPEELAEFQSSAARIVEQLKVVSPQVLSAAERNAALVGQMRAAELAASGASVSSALVIPDLSSAAICQDFTVGVEHYDGNRAYLRLTRGGETSDIVASPGDGVSLSQNGIKAGAVLAGIRGTDPLFYGIDFTCDKVKK